MLQQKRQSEVRSNICSDPQKQIPTQDIATRAARRGWTGKQVTLTQWVKNRVGGSAVGLYQLSLALCILSFLLGVPTMAVLWRLFPSLVMPGFTVGGAMMLIGLIGLPMTLIAMYAKIARSASRDPIPQEEGVHAIGPLLDRMMTDVLQISELRERLARLLPRLQSEDASLLEARHYELLNGYLHRRVWGSHSWQRGEKAYLLAVLDAYARVGDTRALPDVERIAQGKVTSVLQDAEIRNAAQRCLPHLQQNAEQLRMQETLLRSSQISGASENLLRPAAAATDTGSHQLLRAVDDSDTSA